MEYNGYNMNERKMQIKIIILLNKKLLYISKINCDECKENKKSNTYNNEIFKCITC